jgi:hypothetical protein
MWCGFLVSDWILSSYGGIFGVHLCAETHGYSSLRRSVHLVQQSGMV